jgi:hypothetical protein
MLRFLVDLDRRSFVTFFMALRNGTFGPEFEQAVRHDGGCLWCDADQGETHRPDCQKDQFRKFAEEYRQRGFNPPRPRKPQTPEWHQQLIRDDTGKPLKGAANAAIAMREDPALSGILGFDLATKKIMLKGRLPDDWEPDFTMRVLTETDASGLYEYLLRQGLRLTRAEMLTALKRIARENPMGGDQ